VLNKLLSNIKFRPKLTIQGFLLYSPISILGFPVSVLISNEDANKIQMFGYGLFLTIATFMIYQTLIFASNRFNRGIKTRLLVFIVIPIIAGGSRGLLFYWLVNKLNLIQPSDLLHRFISSLLTTIFWLYLANYLIGVSKNFLFQYQAALNQYLGNIEDEKQLVKISPQNAKALSELQLNLSASVEAYIDKNDPESFKKLSSALAAQINDQIRPLSRRIWIENLTEFPMVKYAQLFKDSLSTLVFSWRWFIFLIITLSFLGNLAIRGLYETFWRILPFAFVLFGLRFIYDRMINVRELSAFKFNLISLALFGFMPVVVSELFVNAIGYSGSWTATFLISPVVPVLMLALSFLHLTNQDRNMILGILKRSSPETLLNRPRAKNIEDASVASYLHNSLQSELLALSRQLEKAAENPDPTKSAALLQQVSSRVNRSIAEDFVRFAESPQERLVSVVNSWNGILEIQIKFQSDLLAVNSKAAYIVQTIEEVASNVSRYDNASTLIVTAEIKHSSIVLNFQSNGAGKLVKAKGLGSAWFNQVALAPWTIEKNSIGSLLIIEI
jgi:hypothetical protein